VISVIFSTYNSTAWLQKVLWGYAVQSSRDFEIVVADDGSTGETAALLASMRDEVGVALRHVWQPDDGFQKSRILNKAILVAKGDYLVFSDGDCVPRSDFVATHAGARQPGRFLSGGYFKLPLGLSRLVTREDIESQRMFDYRWLVANGLSRTMKGLKLTARGGLRSVLNAVTTTKPTWNGHNASCWKRDAFAVNGFDERMQYGGQDREFGERLENTGIRGVQIRYDAIVVHLDHARGYARPESIAKNRAIRRETRGRGVRRTEHGIDRHDPSTIVVREPA
jgi:glycosyltransferase involved in cell wall biosynthesis